MTDKTRPAPLLNQLYHRYLIDQDPTALIAKVRAHYLPGTLERLIEHDQRVTRRAAVLALGLVGDLRSNAAVARAMLDHDQGVRTLAENAIRAIWYRSGNRLHRRGLSLVICLNAKRRYEDAIRRATQLIKLAPDMAEGWNQRAIGYFHTGRYNDSIRDCRQVLKLNPHHFGAATGMGQCYLQLRDPAAALESFRLALKLNPSMENVRAKVLYLQRSLKEQG